MPIWIIAKKELRLLLRDRRAALILLALPLVFIFILGLLLGETFGQKADDRQRVSLVDLDQGYAFEEGMAWFAAAPPTGNALTALTLAEANHSGRFPGEPWSRVVRRDLAETAGIRLEVIDRRADAEELVRDHRRAAVLIFEPGFSRQVARCSFLGSSRPLRLAAAIFASSAAGPLHPLPFVADLKPQDAYLIEGINPFHRDGVYLDRVAVTLLKDDKQPGEAAIVDQIAQVTLLRVLLPWMIGRAFERLSDPAFIEILGEEVNLPVPKAWQLVVRNERLSLNKLLMMAAGGDPANALEYKNKVGGGVQNALREQFKKYELTGKTWAALTRSTEERQGEGADVSSYVNRDGTGLLNRGAHRYQLLVPSYTVMFAFFLVMVVGWLFVSERRQGTLKRLRAAPLTQGQILLGKLLPCFLLSLGQEALLLVAGKAVFGMRWGPDAWPLAKQVLWLFPVVFATSLAAMGLALLVAALARTEIQVALYGAVPALVLALIGGCILPRELMPEDTQQLSLITPQGWALAAYRELLDPNPNSNPNLAIVARACAVLAGFGAGFLGLAWRFLKLE